MVKEVIWLKRSKNSFRKVIEYLTDKWSISVAEEFYFRTHAIIEILKEHPDAGKEIKERQPVRQFLVTKHNYLVYKIVKDKLIIVNIVDTRQRTA